MTKISVKRNFIANMHYKLFCRRFAFIRVNGVAEFSIQIVDVSVGPSLRYAILNILIYTAYGFAVFFCQSGVTVEF